MSQTGRSTFATWPGDTLDLKPRKRPRRYPHRVEARRYHVSACHRDRPEQPPSPPGDVQGQLHVAQSRHEQPVRPSPDIRRQTLVIQTRQAQRDRRLSKRARLLDSQRQPGLQRPEEQVPQLAATADPGLEPGEQNGTATTPHQRQTLAAGRKPRPGHPFRTSNEPRTRRPWPFGDHPRRQAPRAARPSTRKSSRTRRWLCSHPATRTATRSAGVCDGNPPTCKAQPAATTAPAPARPIANLATTLRTPLMLGRLIRTGRPWRRTVA